MKQKIARYFGLENKPSSGATKVLIPARPHCKVSPVVSQGRDGGGGGGGEEVILLMISCHRNRN